MSLPLALQSESVFLRFFEQSPCVGLIFDAQGQLVHVNEAARRFTGCNDALLRTRTDLLAPFAGAGEPEPDARWFETVVASRTLPLQTDSQWLGGSGQMRNLRWSNQILRCGADQQVYVISLGTDISALAARERSLRRSRDFTTFQARVNRALVQGREEPVVLQEITRLAVEYAGVPLAWFGRPDASGMFQVLASAGPARSYLDGIRISADMSPPDGGGLAARSWHTGQALFNEQFERNPLLAPWRARASREGLQSSASLPIRRGGRMWAVLNVYLPERVEFDDALRAVLRQAAHDISLGLDALDARRLNFALTHNTDVGIAVVTSRRLDYVNFRFAEMFGEASPVAVQGQSTRELYADQETFERVGTGYRDIERDGVVRMRDVPCRRQDGGIMVCDMTGTDLGGESSVWTWIDVTARARQARQISRLSQYNALLAQVNHVITRVSSETELMGTVCELAVTYADVSLAWVGRPDENGWFRFLASAGPASGYLGDADISVDPGVPEGQGGAGRAWRSGEPFFHLDFESDRRAAPWARQAARHGLSTCAVLPVRRGGEVWALLALYSSESGEFDERLTATMKELARHISAGLDFIDLARRERETSALNSMLLDALSVGVVVVRYPENVIEHANSQLLNMAAAGTLEELLAHRPGDFYADPDARADMEALAAQVLENGQGAMRNVHSRRLDGDSLWVDVFGYRVDRGDAVQRIIWTHVDVTERHNNESAINALSALRKTLLDNTVVGISLVRYPERRIIEANQGFLDMLGYSDEPETLLGRSAEIVYAETGEGRRMGDLASRILREGGGSLSDLEVKRRDGSLMYVDIHGRRLEGSDPEHPVIVWTSVDVTKRLALARELNRQALFDPLTGLPNRRALDQHVTLAIARARRHGTRIALGMVDLDDFKPVNDRYGHPAGDTLLKAFAQRMKARLRDSDFVARMGGDEFVTVMEDIDPDLEGQSLSAIWSHLHSAVESPFDLGQNREAKVDMSMGVAMYPTDGEDADALLRRADAAMYHAKAHKVDRVHWWQLDTQAAATPPDTDLFDPFGPQARELLQHLAPHLEVIGQEFAEAFYRELTERPESAAVLSRLTAVEFASLKRRQAEHLSFLLSAASSETDIEQRARKLGEIHALAGITPNWIAQGITLYGKLLRISLERLMFTARRRYRAVRSADARLWLDIQTQLTSMQEVMDAYHAHTARALPDAASWASLAQIELEALATLPGVLGCQIMRPDSEGTFTIQRSAGTISQSIVRVVHGQHLTPRLDNGNGAGRGLINSAWVTGAVQRSDAYGRDPRTRVWHRALETLGVRSFLAVPVRGGQGPEFVLAIEGAFPNQFSTGWMRSFAASLQQRWRQLSTLANQRVAPLRQDQAEAYCNLLYGDGLQLFAQPVVSVDDGALKKVETLARLVTADGKVVGPERFFAALRDDDFHFLFRRGLAQSLGHLKRWQARGIDIDLSLNLAPSTLIHPDCASWVDESLRQQAVRPERLTLEVLESQDFDEHKHDAAIERLRRLGVRLAIDDLGSGYSSLKRLSRLPFDVVKIDQALVRDFAVDPVKTLNLLRTLVLIGRDLDRKVVLEGVETAGLMEAARILEAHYAQGFAIAAPMPADELPGWLESWRCPSARGDSLRTSLGALALHWQGEPDADGSGSGETALSAFLRERETATTDEVVLWHRQIHGADSHEERAAARDRLTRWLVDQVRIDAADTSGR